ncbi:IS3 family transposase [Catellatospora sichuanensis]|uniref:IS3 family transposase n=1 Tax=Catellatospora sichuanensis TaxID=1969805 RepID=UPI0011843EF2
MRPSMGRTGICFDNSAAESFFATLKAEIGTRVWVTRHQARQAVFEYIEIYCNRRRLHFDAWLPHAPRGAQRLLPPRTRPRGVRTRCPPPG